ncbi:MAG: hypothetical protein WKG00_40540 [Polyangiaceae bacterium]
MHSEMVKLRADNAVLSERLDGVELRGTPARSAPAAGAAAAKAPARDTPDLQVVKLGPEAAQEAAEPLLAATEKPVVIRGSGSTATIDGVPSKPASSGAPEGSPKKTAPMSGAAPKAATGTAAGAALARQSVKAVAP